MPQGAVQKQRGQHFQCGVALRSRVLVIGSREEKEEEEDKNLEKAFRILKGV